MEKDELKRLSDKVKIFNQLNSHDNMFSVDWLMSMLGIDQRDIRIVKINKIYGETREI